MMRFTPGPWRWELNLKNKQLALVGGSNKFDLTVARPTRWGMGGATMMFRDPDHFAMNVMGKVHERPDWFGDFTNRSHHADWCSALTHPDAMLIQAAPMLMAALDLIANDPELTADAAKTIAHQAIDQAGREWPIKVKL